MCAILGSPKAWSIVKNRKTRKRKRFMVCYTNRNDRLSELGLTYKQYLASDEWKKIREEVLVCCPNCILCGEPAFQVHHTDYEWDTLLGLDKRGLAPLCNECHQFIEFNQEIKRTLAEANSVLVEILKSKINQQSNEWLRNYFKRRKISKSVQKIVDDGEKYRRKNRKKKSKEEFRRINGNIER